MDKSTHDIRTLNWSEAIREEWLMNYNWEKEKQARTAEENKKLKKEKKKMKYELKQKDAEIARLNEELREANANKKD